MDLEANLFFNFIPIISTTIVTLVTWITIFYKLKNRWPIKVNCWFCNNNSKIERQSLDWWLCRYCSQYNGFSENGDYNYEIPEQHKIVNSNSCKDASYCERRNISINHNKLCKQCNRKEELKLLKLRELEDSINVYNDKQIAQFESSFEKKYPLCLNCQNIVTNVLDKQTLWLAQYKMLFFKHKPIRKIIDNRVQIEKCLRIILSVLASITIYFSEVSYFPLCGIFFQLAACLTSPINKRKFDILPLIGWTCLIFVSAFSSSTILKMLKICSNESMPVNDSTYYYFIITLGTAIGLANIKFKSSKTVSNSFLTFKKLESPNKSTFICHSSSSEANFIDHNKNSMRNSPVNLTDSLGMPSIIETPIPLKSTNFSQWSPGEKNCYSSNYILSKELTFLTETEKPFGNRTYSVNDSLTSLNSLSLGTQERNSSVNTPRIFESRIYSTVSPDLFNKHQQYGQRRSILAPAKLRSVTQTSWVAGGYWQSGIDTPTLSRSSSQSSGFGSSGSNCGLSREPSDHEFDQYSMISEHSCFARSENPMSIKASNLVKKRSGNCTPKCTHMNEIASGSESAHHDLLNYIHCSEHPTFLANSVWLLALLCGSLMLNMAVLCTTLLR